MHDSGNGFWPAPLARAFHLMPGPKTTLERVARRIPLDSKTTPRAVSGESPAIYVTANRCFEMGEALCIGERQCLCEGKLVRNFRRKFS